MPQLIIAITIIFVIFFLFWGIAVCAPVILIYVLCWGIYKSSILAYEHFYFKSKKFLQIKSNLAKNAENFNGLNKHICDLKKSYINIKAESQCQAEYYDKNSVYNFKRPHLKDFVSDKYVYHCSLSVCRNAKIEPFKYFCKYFNIKADEDTLSKFEDVFNQFSAAEEGIRILKKEREDILENLSDKVPFIIRKYSKNKLIKNLGFDDIKINDIFYPKYSFIYVSAGGNSKMCTDIKFDINNLEKFIKYIANIIKFQNSVKGQRALMTSSLREEILKRDNYTCQNCGLSINDEPNLLLEIDHIIPVSKGGMTTKSNLQTLCWKCNRSKSNKLTE